MEIIAVPGTFIKRLAIVVVSIAAAASRAGCETPQPLSIDERIWFDKAVGQDLIPVRPALPYPPAEFGPPPYAPAPY